MDAFKQFIGGMAFVCASALVYSAARNGADLGALADWIAGGATAAGVWVALSTAQRASMEARAAAIEAREAARYDRARLLYREHYNAYAAALNAVEIAAHRIKTTKDGMELTGAAEKLTVLFLVRQLEADHSLLMGLNLVLLDPATAHKITTVAGTLMSAKDMLEAVIEANPRTEAAAVRETERCARNLGSLCIAISQVQDQIIPMANIGIAGFARGFGLPPSVFRKAGQG